MDPLSTSSWKQASDHCWRTVEKATQLAGVIDTLKDIEVVSVIPLVSSLQTTLIITPPEPMDREGVTQFCDVIRRTLKTEERWQSFSIADNFGLRLRLPNGVNVEIQTFIPTSEPTELNV